MTPNNLAPPGDEAVDDLDELSEVLPGAFAITSYSADYPVDERKAAVNSLVALRHKIAHGESVGTSLAQVKPYYKTVLEVIDEIAKVVA